MIYEDDIYDNTVSEKYGCKIFGDKNAPKVRKLKEDDFGEYQKREDSRKTTKASRSNRFK